ncbi:MAG: hypothetical protein GDA51_01090 [Ekhidna sp.]|nr:hypothetical protein [Ekhidna sp.]MBC6425077.1 hypothetical protein [Ekhidna sp.]
MSKSNFKYGKKYSDIINRENGNPNITHTTAIANTHTYITADIYTVYHLASLPLYPVRVS